jgi:hypothetical protein
MLARLVRGMTSSPSTRETVKSSLSLAASAESRPPGGEYAKHRTPLSGYLHLWPTEKEIFNVQLCKIKDYKNEIPVLLLPYLMSCLDSSAHARSVMETTPYNHNFVC